MRNQMPKENVRLACVAKWCYELILRKLLINFAKNVPL